MATAPAEGAPARIEADPQAAEEFSALISMLIPGAVPENAPQAAAPAMTPEKGGSPEKKGSGEPKGEPKKDGKSEQPVVFPFPVQAFVRPAEIQRPAGGGTFTLEPEAAPARQMNEADAPAPELKAEVAATPQVDAGEMPLMAQSETAVPPEPAETEAVPDSMPAPATARSVDSVDSVDQLPPAVPMRAEEQAAAPEAVPETTGPAETEAAAPVPTTPVAVPATAAAPAAAAPQAVQAPDTRQVARPMDAARPATRKDRSGTQVETGFEVAEAPANPRQPAAEAELAFAARLTERAPAVSSAGPVPADSRQPAPANPAAAEPQQAPRAPEVPSETEPARREAAAAGYNRPAPEPGARNRPAETDQPAVTAPKPAIGAHPDPVAPQAAPAQPARPAGQTAPPERPAAPNPVVRTDFEPARTDAAPQPVRELSMVVPRPVSGDMRMEPVEVRVLERAGQVHVAVRSSDPQFNRSLGEGLGELVTNLESRGYATETFRPQSTGAAHTVLTAAADGPVQQTQAGAGRESFEESGRGHHGEAGDESSRQQQRRGQDQERPQWLEMLEGAVRQRNNTIRSTFA